MKKTMPKATMVSFIRRNLMQGMKLNEISFKSPLNAMYMLRNSHFSFKETDLVKKNLNTQEQIRK